MILIIIFILVGSPLCVMLRKLVETDKTEHGHTPTTSSVSVLSGIFRAIQRIQLILVSLMYDPLHYCTFVYCLFIGH
jgi:hypothetical protein